MLIHSLLFPDELFYLVEHQVWARLHADATATVGITSMGIRVAGEIYMCRPKPVGAQLEQGRSVAVVELAKSIVSVKSPVRGRVCELNPRLEGEPELVHLDPYGAGWLARVALDDWSDSQTRLLQGAAIIPAMQHYAWLNQVERT